MVKWLVGWFQDVKLLGDKLLVVKLTVVSALVGGELSTELYSP